MARTTPRFTLVAAAAVALASCGIALGGPRLVVEPESVDLGTVIRGEEVDAGFVLRNEGDEALQVLKAKPG